MVTASTSVNDGNNADAVGILYIADTQPLAIDFSEHVRLPVHTRIPDAGVGEYREHLFFRNDASPRILHALPCMARKHHGLGQSHGNYPAAASKRSRLPPRIFSWSAFGTKPQCVRKASRAWR